MMKKAGALLEWAGAKIRTLLLGIAVNESLFLFAAILPSLVFDSQLFVWHREAANTFYNYVVVPWGMALCLVRLERRNRLECAPHRTDIAILFALVAWIVVPFAIRFGLTFNNATSWYGHCAAYFALYAMTSEETAKRREQLLDHACAVFGIFSLVMGGALLLCAATGIQIDSNWIVHYGTFDESGYCFGVYKREQLCSGLHYNYTGMMGLICTMFCFAGVSRGKNRLVRLLYMIGAAMMMTVIVLTQSRTARYALIIGMGMGVYGYLASCAKISRRVLRHAAGIVCAVAVMGVSYFGASALTDAALKHYGELGKVERVSIVAHAVASEIMPETTSKPEFERKQFKPKEARSIGDASLSGRTNFWKHLFNFWKQNPKEFVIGAGQGRIGSRVVQNTFAEELGSIALHNSYLQYAADYGLIGFALLALFFLSIVRQVLRTFFAPQDKRIPGYTAMGMLVIGALLTGMLESWTFGAMTALNAAMVFALAMLVSRGRELAENGKK